MKTKAFMVLCLLAFLASTAVAAELEEKWVYTSSNLLFDANADAFIDLLEKASAAGVTHVQLSDYQSGFMWDMPPRYFENVARVKDAARKAGIIIAPMVFPIGSCGRYLYNDPNLADGMPVRDMRFVASKGLALPDPAAAPEVPNGGFEEALGGAPAGWTIEMRRQTAAGADEIDEGDALAAAGSAAGGVTIDRSTAAVGSASLKVAAPEGARSAGPMGVRRRVKVQPFQAYVLSVWMKTDGITPERHPVQILGARDGRSLCFAYFFKNPEAYWPPRDLSSEIIASGGNSIWVGGWADFGIQATGDWAEYRVVFHSLDYDEIEIYAGFSRANTGSMWFDDIRLMPAGLQNVIRRDLTPLVVKSADGRTTYVETLDYHYVSDPLMGRAPTRGDFMVSSRGTFDFWHDGPAIRLTENSRIREGDALLVSFYSPGMIYVKQQVTVSLSDPIVFETMEREMKWVSRVWDSPCYMMGYDEIRTGGWEPQPGGATLTIGQQLANHVSRAVDIIRKYAPDARIYVWSDMFDPYHNARDLGPGEYYYLVNGSWAGSWEGLPSDVIIYKWGSARPIADSTRFFAERGHRMVLSGFPIDTWLTATQGVPGIVGFSYTVWDGNYDGMPAFFEELAAWPDKPAAK